ncbi:MAG: hypothetical protein II840_13395 [Kiritimatiellae bacterium]|nr:hypothetical protein [Kiritimatiellia bacterium]
MKAGKHHMGRRRGETPQRRYVLRPRQLEAGAERRQPHGAAWRSDARFTPLADIEDVASKQNYDAMVERYGKDLIGAWDGKWLFRYGNAPGMVVFIRSIGAPGSLS